MPKVKKIPVRGPPEPPSPGLLKRHILGRFSACRHQPPPPGRSNSAFQTVFFFDIFWMNFAPFFSLGKKTQEKGPENPRANDDGSEHTTASLGSDAPLLRCHPLPPPPRRLREGLRRRSLTPSSQISMPCATVWPGTVRATLGGGPARSQGRGPPALHPIWPAGRAAHDPCQARSSLWEVLLSHIPFQHEIFRGKNDEKLAIVFLPIGNFSEKAVCHATVRNHPRGSASFPASFPTTATAHCHTFRRGGLIDHSQQVKTIA